MITIEKLYQLLNRAIVCIVGAFVRSSCGRKFCEVLSIMPQKLHVLRCYSCKMYQVQITKKVPKWQCKICNEKQMIQAIYFQGSGAECRKYVQAQNMESAKEKELAVIDAWGFDCEADEDSKDSCDCNERKLTAQKLTSFLSSDEYESKENLELSQHSSKRQKLNCGGRRTRSLPSDNFSCSDEWGRKPRSCPAAEKKFDRPNKYDKFLEPETVLEFEEEKIEWNRSSEEKWPHFLESEHQNSHLEDSSRSDTSPKSDSPENNHETHGNGLENDHKLVDQKIKACGDLISSQVDGSSNSSRSSLRGFVTNLFEDLDNDLDFELDF